ncbi:MAG: hypothetical protein BWY04_00256 [candidate division CPR1 bacterium ADurb.Bin160]|uniref:Uncharacterized protein n=1 Tax=candidate division CPR1 bacterium ADurb.Bin160 TaxID=1852826 RepID=A0A1V5ZQA8_9BACT|nr:MAG: hypothetical protein BWY04_00256 [candidate division CPR1 bacterium ADurb.Bin160]
MALAHSRADHMETLSHLSLFQTFPILLAVVRYLPSVLSAKATHITISLSIFVHFTASSQNANSL